MDAVAVRRRVIRWDRPALPDAALSGLDGLRAMAAGESPAPPAIALIGMAVQSVDIGRVRMTLTPAEYHYNPIGTVHGGVIATALDTVMACAVQSTLPPGRRCVTLEIKVNYLRALTEASGEVVAEGTCVHAGRQVGVAEGRITDGKGRAYATASTTLLVFDLPEAQPIPDDGVRERVVTWDDPRAGASAGRGMAGIDYLRAIQAATVPRAPIGALLGFDITGIEPGRVTMTLPPGGHMNNLNGAMHGGMMATLLDSVLGCAVHSTVPQGRGYTTLEIKVNYLRAVTAASGLITAVGQVVHGGRQMAAAEARATDAAGQLCAIGSTTCLLFDLPR
jgi:uncharacterized protein (TIGR00369 family)